VIKITNFKDQIVAPGGIDVRRLVPNVIFS